MKDNPLEVDFFGKKAHSPLVLASGILDVSFSSMVRCVEFGCGIVTTKSLTMEPRKGHEGPIVSEFAGGFMNSVGLSNPGIHVGLKEVDEFRRRSDAPIIVSIFAPDTEGFIDLIKSTNHSNADAVELNLSCPNVADEFGIPLAASKEKVCEIIQEVKKVSALPVIAKLSPNTYNVPEIAEYAYQAGADALTLINTLGPGMIINVEAGKPVMQSKFGGISGAAIKPIAIKLIYQIKKIVAIPIIGMGGLLSAQDGLEFLFAGASFLGVGTAVYTNGFEIFTALNDGLRQYLQMRGLTHISDIKPIE